MRSRGVGTGGGCGKARVTDGLGQGRMCRDASGGKREKTNETGQAINTTLIVVCHRGYIPKGHRRRLSSLPRRTHSVTRFLPVRTDARDEAACLTAWGGQDKRGRIQPDPSGSCYEWWQNKASQATARKVGSRGGVQRASVLDRGAESWDRKKKKKQHLRRYPKGGYLQPNHVVDNVSWSLRYPSHQLPSVCPRQQNTNNQCLFSGESGLMSGMSRSSGTGQGQGR